jgi:Raf kinase inhibitor-like YbhB/YbcL family protein
VIFNIPADAHALPRNAGDPSKGLAPGQSVQSRTDYGSPGFGGACPPVGDKAHRYQFRLYALDVERLDLAPDSSAALVGFMLNQHKLAVAEIEATYRR